MSLKQKAISGLSWSFLDNFINQGITFVVGIVLARLIAPEEFGVIGMITLFLAVSGTFVDSGFGSALIRKKDCTEEDYNTVFYFNLGVSIFFYLLLFFCSPLVARFFDEPRLDLILKVLSLNLIIGAASQIQSVILTKNVNFKRVAKISVISSVSSGLIGIVCAYGGLGVWSLVWRMVLGALFTSLLLWVWGNWRPRRIFSLKSFKELFSFGSKLLASALLDTIYRNIYYPIIGKFFTPATLGFYTRAESYCNLFSSTLTGNIQRVSYPLLAQVQDDPVLLKATYRRMIRATMLVAFVCMLGLAAVASPLIEVLIGRVWLPAAPYMQLMCFSAMLYPLHALNLNAINVRGRSDLFLRLEIIKKTISIPLIFVGIYWGVEALLIGRIVISVISYFLNSYYSAALIAYPAWQQIKDILPSFGIALTGAALTWLISLIGMNSWYTLSVQLVFGGLFIIGVCHWLKLPEYIEIKNIVVENVKKIQSGIKR